MHDELRSRWINNTNVYNVPCDRTLSLVAITARRSRVRSNDVVAVVVSLH